MRPPVVAEILVEWLCGDGQHADIPSDLEEEFQYNLSKKGLFRAKIKYLWTAIRLIRPFILKDKFLRNSKIANSAIIKSSLTTFRRNTVREKTNFTLSFLGLSLGLACFLLILNYVTHELSYDRFHEKSDSIYRVTYSKKKDGSTSFHTVLTYAGIGHPLKQEFDEITEFVRMRPVNVVNARTFVCTDSEAFEENRIYFVDPSFLTIFSFDLLQGSVNSALQNPFEAVISRSIAKKYFGDEDPIGQILEFGDEDQFTITGVLEDAPQNSQIQYNILLSHASLSDIMPDWSEDNMEVFHGQLFIETKKSTDIEAIKAKLPKFIDDFIWTRQTKVDGLELELSMMPLTDIHLKSEASHDMEPSGNNRIINLLLWTATLVLILAWANHTNLMIAKSVERLKELGIRLVLGSSKNLFFRQTMIESGIVHFSALILAIAMVYLAGPLLNDLGVFGKSVPAPSQNISFWLIFLALFIFGTLSTGLVSTLSFFKYGPSLKLRLLQAFPGKIIRTSKFRNGLVVFQLSICVMLLSGAVIGYLQLNYLRSAELGIDIEKALVVRTAMTVDSTYNFRTGRFKEEVSAYSSVKTVTFSTDIPGSRITRSTWYKILNDSDANSQYAYRSYVDENFIPAFEIELIAGRNFTKDYLNYELASGGDSIPRARHAIINEAFMKGLKIDHAEDAIGLLLTYEENDSAEEIFRVIGVTKDYYQLSVKAKSVPQIVFYGETAIENFVIKLSPTLKSTEEMVDAISNVEIAYTKYFPNNKFRASFLDAEFEKLYKADRELKNTFILFSAMAILVTSLGLLGLSLHNVIQRSKEISIRKILGSSATQITGYLLSDYIKLIVLANVITWPISYYLLDYWLNYTSDNHINVEWWLFPGIFLFICLVALFTVANNTFRAAKMRPIQFLKTE